MSKKKELKKLKWDDNLYILFNKPWSNSISFLLNYFNLGYKFGVVGLLAIGLGRSLSMNKHKEKQREKEK